MTEKSGQLHITSDIPIEEFAAKRKESKKKRIS